jgi:hypothetical protein
VFHFAIPFGGCDLICNAFCKRRVLQNQSANVLPLRCPGLEVVLIGGGGVEGREALNLPLIYP